MKIALIGYGGMGRTIERVAIERGHTIVAKIDPTSADATERSISRSSLNAAELAIEFTHPTSAVGNLIALAELHTPVVSGTTGWYASVEAVKEHVLKNSTALLYSANFSIGVNLFYKVVRNAAALMEHFDEYDVWGTELHHRNKIDSPSGTAKVLAQIITEEMPRKQKVVTEMLERRLLPDEFHFSSTRGGGVNFSHTIGFDSAADTITLNHAARSREGYALGAVKAAEWTVGQVGVFTMDDFLQGLSDAQC